MTTTISIKERTKERFDNAKDEMDGADPDCPDLTADQFMNTLLDTLEHAQGGGYSDDPLDIDGALAEHNGPVTLPDDEREAIAREVSRQLDYAQLAGEVGEEVEERLR